MAKRSDISVGQVRIAAIPAPNEDGTDPECDLQSAVVRVLGWVSPTVVSVEPIVVVGEGGAHEIEVAEDPEPLLVPCSRVGALVHWGVPRDRHDRVVHLADQARRSLRKFSAIADSLRRVENGSPVEWGVVRKDRIGKKDAKAAAVLDRFECDHAGHIARQIQEVLGDGS